MTRRLRYLALACLHLLFSTAFFGRVAADEKHNDGAVIHYEEATWDIVISKGTHVVFLGATWCPHCVALTPTWGKLTEKVGDLQDHNVHVAKVECTENENLCGSQNVRGYPSIFVFHDGKRVDEYQGDRSLPDLERFVRNQAAKYAGVANNNIGTEQHDAGDQEKEEEGREQEEHQEHQQEEGEEQQHDQPEEEEAEAGHDQPAEHHEPPSPPAPAPAPAVAKEAGGQHQQQQQYDLPKAIKDDIQRTCNRMYKSDVPKIAGDRAVVLTAANFDDFIKSGSSFVKFMAPWCTHCQRLQPIWDDKLSQHPKVKGKVNIGKVDCTVQHLLCRKYGVKSFPQLKFFQKDDVIDYRGPRNIDSLVEFCTSQLEVPLVPLHKPELDKAIKSHELHFVLLYDEYESAADLMSHYIRVAKRFRSKAIFHASSDVELISTLDPQAKRSDLPRLYVVRGGNPHNTPRYCGAHDFDGMLAWVTEKVESMLQELNESNVEMLLSGEGGKLTVIGLLDPRRVGDKSFIDELRKASDRIASQKTDSSKRVVFTWMDIGRFGDYAQKVYSFDPSRGEPKVIIADPAGDRFFDSDLAGSPFGLNEAEIVWAATAARAGTLPSRYTDGFIIRQMKRVSKLTQSFGSFLLHRPILAIAMLVGILIFVAYLFVIMDDSSYHAKTGGKAE